MMIVLCSQRASRSSILDALKECARLKDLNKGRAVHADAVKWGHSCNMYVASTVVGMYAKCGSMADARSVFGSMQQRDVVSWNVLILGYAENGQGTEALELFSWMQAACESSADNFTFVAVLKACANLAEREEPNEKLVKVGSLGKAMALHRNAAECMFDTDMNVANTLLNTYCKCGSILSASLLFESMPRHDVVSWTTVILGRAENGEAERALDLFDEMLQSGFAPNAVTYIAALNACTILAENEPGKQVAGKLLKMGSLDKAMRIHSDACSRKCDSHVKVANMLVGTYSKCGSMVNARRVFDGIQRHDIVSWTVLVLGYAENGDGKAALDSYERMIRARCAPDAVTFVAALKACISSAEEEAGKRVGGKLVKARSLEKGMAIHSKAVEQRCAVDIKVSSTLVDMYAKCLSMADARRVFEGMLVRNVVTWTALILGYVLNDQGSEGLSMFHLMRDEGCAPDSFTYVAAFKACALQGALDTGRALHFEVCSRGFDKHPLVASSLIDFYGKCWHMQDAQQVFDALPTKSTVEWTSLLGGYCNHGNTHRVLDVFERMEEAKVRPDRVTFLCLLSACSHAGLVDKGKEYFESMLPRYGIRPGVEHYTCMADMLGRANRLAEAVDLVKGMPFAPDAVTWMVVLAACHKWRNVELGKLAFQKLTSFDEKEAAAYVLMAQLYRHGRV